MYTKALSRFAQSVIAAGVMTVAMQGHAAPLLLPGSNAMTTVQYGDFAVYSLDLTEQCAAAGDPRCLPSGPFPVAAAAGFTKTQLVVMTGENGNQQTDNQPEPLPNGTPADNAFDSPSGNTSGTFLMSAANEPTPTFTGDRVGFWDIQIGALRSYLGLNDLVFIFDNAQQGSAADQWLQIWGQANVLNTAGTVVGCFELNSASVGGCTTPTAPTGPLDTSSSYVTTFTDYCVDKTTGVAFNLGTGTSQTCAAANGYYVNGNIGSAIADNAVFSQGLNDFVFAATTQDDWILSLDIRTANNNGGAETLWICESCKVSGQSVPEPGTLTLLGLALFGLAAYRRRQA